MGVQAKGPGFNSQSPCLIYVQRSYLLLGELGFGLVFLPLPVVPAEGELWSQRSLCCQSDPGPPVGLKHKPLEHLSQNGCLLGGRGRGGVREDKEGGKEKRGSALVLEIV